MLGAVHKAIYVRSMYLLVTVKAVLSRVPGHNAYKVAQQTTRRRLACASAHVSRRARRPPSFVFEQARPTCTGFSPASAPSSLCARLSVLLVFAFDQTFAVNFVTARTQGRPNFFLAPCSHPPFALSEPACAAISQVNFLLGHLS